LQKNTQQRKNTKNFQDSIFFYFRRQGGLYFPENPVCPQFSESVALAIDGKEHATCPAYDISLRYAPESATVDRISAVVSLDVIKTAGQDATNTLDQQQVCVFRAVENNRIANLRTGITRKTAIAPAVIPVGFAERPYPRESVYYRHVGPALGQPGSIRRPVYPQPVSGKYGRRHAVGRHAARLPNKDTQEDYGKQNNCGKTADPEETLHPFNPSCLLPE
jgi:hypothetical protein